MPTVFREEAIAFHQPTLDSSFDGKAAPRKEDHSGGSIR